MEDELDHPLGPLRERGRRLEVEEAEQVDGEEGEEERERHRGRAGEPAVEPLEPPEGEGNEEERRQHVGQREVAADVPVELLEGDRGDGREEQRVDERLAAGQHSDLRSPAVSSTRVERASSWRHFSDRGTSGRPSPAKRRWSSSSASRMASTSSGGTTMPAPVSRIRVGGGAVRGHRGEDRPSRRDVLEHLAREHPLATAARVGDQEQQRLGVALESERRRAGRVRDQLEPVAEAELGRPFAVGAAEVAEEAGDARRARSRASACRNGRGSRLPKKLPVCVIRRRSPGA